MSLHPPKTVQDVLRQKTPIAPRCSYVWNGITIEKRFARRPVVHHVEVSKPRGTGVGENKLEFSSRYEGDA